MKKMTLLIALVTVAILAGSAGTSPAWAHWRWGLGFYAAPPVVVAPPPAVYYRGYYPPYAYYGPGYGYDPGYRAWVPGHWEERRVPGGWERFWIPGYWDYR
jgi:hypothetical protein